MTDINNNHHLSYAESEKISQRIIAIADEIIKARHRLLSSQSSVKTIGKNRFIGAVSRFLFDRKWRPRQLNEKILKHKESEIGSSLFGGSTNKKHVMFFNDDRTNWYFYQGMIDPKNPHLTTKSLTLHYEVRQQDILRIDNHNNKVNYMILGGEELKNFVSATNLYYQLVMKHIYGEVDINKSKNQK